MNKYNAKKTTVDGITFDSQKEANRYCELMLLQRAGEIGGLTLQPKFPLQEGFTHKGVKYRPIVYVADFAYYELPSRRYVVEDVKGVKTKEYQLKKKLLLFQHPEMYFMEV